ncbi:MAG: hypothetical protein LBJ93_03630 [Clostridiales bacterium]|jgi:hypothetical protein|nr:hypothetical protein [Clostridiales bacterium]
MVTLALENNIITPEYVGRFLDLRTRQRIAIEAIRNSDYSYYKFIEEFFNLYKGIDIFRKDFKSVFTGDFNDFLMNRFVVVLIEVHDNPMNSYTLFNLNHLKDFIRMVMNLIEEFGERLLEEEFKKLKELRNLLGKKFKLLVYLEVDNYSLGRCYEFMNSVEQTLRFSDFNTFDPKSFGLQSFDPEPFEIELSDLKPSDRAVVIFESLKRNPYKADEVNVRTN